MNFLFINPPNSPFSSEAILIEPIDVLACATFAKSHGANCFVLDMDRQKLTSQDVLNFCINNSIDAIVVVWDYHIPLHSEGVANAVKDLFNINFEKPILKILAGKLATFGTEHDLRDYAADLYVQHEIEPFLKSVLEQSSISDVLAKKRSLKNIRFFQANTLFSSAHSLIGTDIAQHPIPDRSLLPISDYIDVRTILSSRGCNLKCTFCHVPGFWGSWRGRRAEQIVDEIHYLEENFQAKKILFLDDNAAANPKHLNDIVQILKSRPTNAKLGLLSTILGFREALFKDMFDVGFRWVHFGAESADDATLKNMNKAITFDKTKQVVACAKNIGFRVRTSWILDMPDHDEITFNKTCQGIYDIQSEEIRLHFLTLRLGSYLHKKFGLNTGQFIHQSKPNINLSKIPQKTLEEGVDHLIAQLVKKEYNLVTNPNEFTALAKRAEAGEVVKIVSLCPLRYGLNW